MRKALIAIGVAILATQVGCPHNSNPTTGYTVSFWGTTGVPADGTSQSKLFVTVFDDQLNTVPGLTVAFTSSRGAVDTLVQPTQPTTSSTDAGVEGFVTSTTSGLAIISMTLNGEAREEVAPVVFKPPACTMMCDAGPADAGATDSGTASDSGAAVDSGTAVDAGTPADAATSADA